MKMSKTIREVLEKVFKAEDEHFNYEHIYPRIDQAEAEIKTLMFEDYKLGYEQGNEDGKARENKKLKALMDGEILSDVLYHAMTAEGLEFCEEDCVNIAKAIIQWWEGR